MTTYSYQGNKRYWQPRHEKTVNTDQVNDISIQSENENSDYEKPTDVTGMKWELRSVMRLLRYYGAHRCLWDVRDVNNRSRKIRRAALVDIAAAISENLTPQQVVRKINVLRATYRYEKRRIKQRMRKGLGARTKLKWFALADKFLRNVPRTEKSRRKAAHSDSDLDDSIVFKVEPDTIVSLNGAQQIKEPQNFVDSINELVSIIEKHPEVLKENMQTETLEAMATEMKKPIQIVATKILKFLIIYNDEKLKQKLDSTYKSNLNWWPLAENLMLCKEDSKNDMKGRAVNEYNDNFIDIHELPPLTPMPMNTQDNKIQMPDTNTHLIWNGLEDNLLEGKWSLQYSVKFLRLYGVHRCLWDLNDPDYRSRELRAAAIEDIASAMGHGLNADFVTKKIKIFRITYMQHRKRMLAAQKQGKEPKIQLLWFPLADSFLRKHIGLRSIGSTEPEIPQFDYQDVVTNLNLIDPGLLTQFEGKGTQNTIEIGSSIVSDVR